MDDAEPETDVQIVPVASGAWALSDVAARLAPERRAVLFDGRGAPAGLARWSMLCWDPVDVVDVSVGDGVLRPGEPDVFARVDEALERRWPGRPRTDAAPRDERLPPFRGGAAGWFGYDLGRQLERLPSTIRADATLPDLSCGIYPCVLAERLDTGERLAVGRAPRAEVAAFARDAERLGASPTPRPICEVAARALSSTFTREAYIAAVEAAIEHIRDGHVYQVNLSQRFCAPIVGSPAALHAALRERFPAPFSATLTTPCATVVSSSPELFLRRRGATVESRPIKGTRPRGATPDADARLRAELEASVKERAELAMIVDLVRNDLNRSARVGSVTVDEPFATDAWPTVFHRVATVRAQVDDPVALLRGAFPPGSVTGTPKIRALELIEELEPVRRHVYTGALGWIDAHGDLDLSVAIRIATCVDGRVLIPVGGGITLRSDPVAEFDETLHKARALFDVIGVT